MIQSMTGFGKATAAFKTKKINVEIKSLNSKTLDLSTRIAPLYREKEMEIRQYISKNLERGKVTSPSGLTRMLLQMPLLSTRRLYRIITSKSRRFRLKQAFLSQPTGTALCCVFLM